MKLPSDRIKELSKVTNIIGGEDVVSHDFLWGIIAYLDEQYEQQKTNHDEIDEMLLRRLIFGEQQKPTTVICGECGDEFDIENEGEDTCENCA